MEQVNKEMKGLVSSSLSSWPTRGEKSIAVQIRGVLRYVTVRQVRKIPAGMNCDYDEVAWAFKFLELATGGSGTSRRPPCLGIALNIA